MILALFNLVSKEYARFAAGAVSGQLRPGRGVKRRRPAAGSVPVQGEAE